MPSCNNMFSRYHCLFLEAHLRMRCFHGATTLQWWLRKKVCHWTMQITPWNHAIVSFGVKCIYVDTCSIVSNAESKLWWRFLHTHTHWHTLWNAICFRVYQHPDMVKQTTKTHLKICNHWTTPMLVSTCSQVSKPNCFFLKFWNFGNPTAKWKFAWIWIEQKIPDIHPGRSLKNGWLECYFPFGKVAFEGLC